VSTIVPGDRGRRGLAYTLLTPANRYLSRLPSLPGASYFKLVTPRLAPARFGEYVAVAGDTPVTCPNQPGLEHFLFGLSGDGQVDAGVTHSIANGGFAYIPPSTAFTFTLAAGASAIWIKRPYEPWPGTPEPVAVLGSLGAVPATPTTTPGLLRRELLDPTDPAHDFNISHMEFAPDAALTQYEIHDEEHGLYMTAGGGLYHLDGAEFPVQADDFIYMAPYCPQGFRAGPEGGSYLLYKDTWRDGF
jgi:(S)-ureidoglycine aminohydrolase